MWTFWWYLYTIHHATPFNTFFSNTYEIYMSLILYKILYGQEIKIKGKSILKKS